MAKNYTWDLIVRVTHWTVAGLFLSNYFITEPGSDIHELAGYIVLGTIALRLIWGMIARSPARLSAFKPSIPAAILHIKEVLQTKKDEHEGHNPAGAIMVWLLWSGLIMTGFTGWLSQTDQFWGEDWVIGIHEVFANLTMAAVTVHVCAIIVMTKLTQNSYVKTMLFGDKLR
jgi:cytochrome b